MPKKKIIYITIIFCFVNFLLIYSYGNYVVQTVERRSSQEGTFDVSTKIYRGYGCVGKVIYSRSWYGKDAQCMKKEQLEMAKEYIKNLDTKMFRIK